MANRPPFLSYDADRGQNISAIAAYGRIIPLDKPFVAPEHGRFSVTVDLGLGTATIRSFIPVGRIRELPARVFGEGEVISSAIDLDWPGGPRRFQMAEAYVVPAPGGKVTLAVDTVESHAYVAHFKPGGK